MIRVPKSPTDILASIGLTAEDVKRIADRHNIATPPPKPPEADLTGYRFVRLIKKGLQH